jgi:hypothetical protein
LIFLAHDLSRGLMKRRKGINRLNGFSPNE